MEMVNKVLNRYVRILGTEKVLVFLNAYDDDVFLSGSKLWNLWSKSPIVFENSFFTNLWSITHAGLTYYTVLNQICM